MGRRRCQWTASTRHLPITVVLGLGEASVTTVCGTTRSNWTYDTDGSALSFGEFETVASNCSAEDARHQAEFLAILGTMEEWGTITTLLSASSTTGGADRRFRNRDPYRAGGQFGYLGRRLRDSDRRRHRLDHPDP